MKKRLSTFVSPDVMDALVRLNALRLRTASRLAAPWYKRKNVGKSSLVERDVQVIGWKSVRIGRSVILSSGTWLNVNNEHTHECKISIGDFSYVGRRNFFSSAKKIDISPYFLSGMDCRFLGANHVYSDPMAPYLSTGVTNDAVIRIGANCWFGTGVTVLGSVEIGHGCVIGAAAVVKTNIPAFSLVVGNPARVVKRYDVSSAAWVKLSDFTPVMESMLPNEADYLQILRNRCPTIIMPYPASGPQRGDMA